MKLGSVFPGIMRKFSKGNKSDITNEHATRQMVMNILAWAQYLPDADPILKKKNIDIETYRSMRSDPHISGVIQQRKSGFLKMKYQINQGEAGENVTRFIEDQYKALHSKLHRINSEWLDAPAFGRVYPEVIWQYNNGYYVAADIIARPMEYFHFDQDNRLRFKSKNNRNGDPVPDFKYIDIAHEASYANPYGRRILSECFWAWTFKKGNWKFSSLFLERFVVPKIVGKLPRGVEDEEQKKMQANLELLIQDAVTTIPADGSVEYLETKGGTASSDIFISLLNFANSEISKAFLSQTLTTELAGKTGSFAAADTHAGILDFVINNDVRMIEAGHNQLIEWITFLNFGNVPAPTITYYAEEEVDLKLAQRDQILSTVPGFKWKDVHFQRDYGLKEDEFEMVENKIPPGGNPPVSFAEKTTTTPADDLGDLVPDKALQLQIEQTLKPVFSLIEEGKSFSEINDALVKLYPDMETSQLENMLAKMIFISESMGRGKNE